MNIKSTALLISAIICLGYSQSPASNSQEIKSLTVSQKYLIYDSLKKDSSMSVQQSILIGFGTGLNSIGNTKAIAGAVIVDSFGLAAVLAGGTLLVTSVHNGTAGGICLGAGVVISLVSKLIQANSCVNYARSYNSSILNSLGVVELSDFRIDDKGLGLSLAVRFR